MRKVARWRKKTFVSTKRKTSESLITAPRTFPFLCDYFVKPETAYEISMALVTFCFGPVFGMVTVRMPSSTLAEIWSRTTSSGSV